MKTKLVLLSVVLLLASCDVIVVESRYDPRDPVTGSYYIEEYSQTYNAHSQFYMTIRKGRYNTDELLIDNFYNAEVTVHAEFAGGKIYIPRQLVNGYEIEGVATVYGSQIEWNYQVRDTYQSYQRVDFCEATSWFE